MMRAMTDGTGDTGWRWKTADVEQNAALDLLYEPGNWGDVLKGLWVAPVARALADGAGGAGLHVVDPFAGAPVWPLTAGAAARYASLPAGGLLALQRPFLEQGRLLSTGRLALEAARVAGAPATAEVFDVDDARRGRWAEERDVSLLEIARGEDALRPGRARWTPVGREAGARGAGSSAAGARREASSRGTAARLLLVDPYDLFERHEELVPPALDRAHRATVLLYLFNKAPRGAAQFARWERLRDGVRAMLRAEQGERAWLAGRIPADARLPRAWHEVVLVAPRPLVDRLRDELRETTEALAARLATEGAFEE